MGFKYKVDSSGFCYNHGKHDGETYEQALISLKNKIIGYFIDNDTIDDFIILVNLDFKMWLLHNTYKDGSHIVREELVDGEIYTKLLGVKCLTSELNDELYIFVKPL